MSTRRDQGQILNHPSIRPPRTGDHKGRPYSSNIGGRRLCASLHRYDFGRCSSPLQIGWSGRLAEKTPSESAPSKPAEVAKFLHAFALHLGAVDIALAVDADEMEVVELAKLVADAAV